MDPPSVVLFCSQGAVEVSTQSNVKAVARLLKTHKLPSRPKLLQNKLFTKKMFGAFNFVIITKESRYKANSLACFLAKRDPPVAATLQRISSGVIISVMITKIITKEIAPRNYFVIISARMVLPCFTSQSPLSTWTGSGSATPDTSHHQRVPQA